jgi:hypothetical protein
MYMAGTRVAHQWPYTGYFWATTPREEIDYAESPRTPEGSPKDHHCMTSDTWKYTVWAMLLDVTLFACGVAVAQPFSLLSNVHCVQMVIHYSSLMGWWGRFRRGLLRPFPLPAVCFLVSTWKCSGCIPGQTFVLHGYTHSHGTVSTSPAISKEFSACCICSLPVHVPSSLSRWIHGHLTGHFSDPGTALDSAHSCWHGFTLSAQESTLPGCNSWPCLSLSRGLVANYRPFLACFLWSPRGSHSLLGLGPWPVLVPPISTPHARLFSECQLWLARCHEISLLAISQALTRYVS